MLLRLNSLPEFILVELFWWAVRKTEAFTVLESFDKMFKELHGRR